MHESKPLTKAETLDLYRTAFSSKSLHLIILPTEKCNFRCSYCYEDFKVPAMQDGVISGINRLIESRSHDIEMLDLSWFGGEPLLAYGTMIKILENSNNVARKSGFIVKSSITTNGFHLDEGRITELHRLGVRSYQITLDGKREDHNKTRISLNKKPTFDTIWGNLLKINKLSEENKIEGTTIIVRIHAHAENIDGIYDLCSDIKEQFSSGTFKIIIRAIWDAGQEFSKDMKLLSRKNERLLDIKRQIISEMPDYYYNDDRSLYVCYAGKANSFMIRADGNIGKCTVALNDERNNIGFLNEDGSMSIDNGKINQWFDGIRNLNRSQIECPARHLPR